MQNQISTFNFKSQSVRIQSLNNEPYFCLTDVCLVLGVNRRSSEAFRLNEKGCNKIAVPTEGGLQEIVFINEPNLYRIIFRSNKAEAVEFQNWVFEEVLPQIRKTGQYSLQNPQPNLPLVEEKKYTFEFTEDTCLRFVSLWFALYNNLALLGQLHQPLSHIGSHFGSTAYTHYTEYQTILGTMKSVLEPMTEAFNPDPRHDAHYYKALKTLRSYQAKGLATLVKHPTPPTRKYDF